MKHVVIKVEANLDQVSLEYLEAKFKKQYEEGLIILPSYCTGFCFDDLAKPTLGLNYEELKQTEEALYKQLGIEGNTEEYQRMIWGSINAIKYILENKL